MAKTLFDRIWESHVVHEEPGEPALLYIDLHLIHEVTSPQAFEGLRLAGRGYAARTSRSRRWITTSRRFRGPITRSARARAARGAARELRRSSASRSTRPGRGREGIVHVIGPELGLTQPGMTIVCGDSHTSTHGAFGALAFGIGTSEVEHVLATQMPAAAAAEDDARSAIDGELPLGVTPKDVILGDDRPHRRRRRRRATCSSTPATPIRGALDGGPHDGLQHVDRGRARAPG